MRTSNSSHSEEQIDRNWAELLQELRVTETGAQILTGFLLTVPFSSRFGDLSDTQRTLYCAVLVGSVLTTGFVVAPAAMHRVLFRHHERPWLVHAADLCAKSGLLLLAVTISGVLGLVFDVALGSTAAVVAGLVALVFLLTLWAGLPVAMRRR